MNFFGTSGTDFLYGTAGSDMMVGPGGADRLYGGDGEDLLIGGDGPATGTLDRLNRTLGLRTTALPGSDGMREEHLAALPAH